MHIRICDFKNVPCYGNTLIIQTLVLCSNYVHGFLADGSIVLPGARSYVNEDFSYRMHTDGTPTSARRLSDPGIIDMCMILTDTVCI